MFWCWNSNRWNVFNLFILKNKNKIKIRETSNFTNQYPEDKLISVLDVHQSLKKNTTKYEEFNQKYNLLEKELEKVQENYKETENSLQNEIKLLETDRQTLIKTLTKKKK